MTNDDGNVYENPDKVREVWGKYFQNLLNHSQSISYDEQSDMKVPVEPCTSTNDLDPTEL